MKIRSLAFTFPEFLFVICILAVASAVLLVPALLKAKRRSSRIGCANNLKQVSLAFKQWSLDNTDRYPMQVSVTNGGTMELVEQGNVFPHFLVMSNELNTPKILLCPEDDERTNAYAFDTYLNDFALIDCQMLSVGLQYPFHVYVPPICMLITPAGRL